MFRTIAAVRDPLTVLDPRRLGSYELVARIGQGGMGTVYLGRGPAGRLVAVKVIRGDLSGDDDYRRRFRSEVSRAREVPPFSTAEVLDADPDHDPPYLVVEYVDGPSLSTVVADGGPMHAAGLQSLAVGIATALSGIHGAGVIHRDLKPANVLLAPGGVKVIDFGIARPAEVTSHHTRTGHMVGTVAYMAPERLDSEAAASVGPAADIFAWGAVVAYAGTGRTPFESTSPTATAMRILMHPPDLAGLPEPIRGIVAATLHKDPRQRPTARELLDMLLRGGRPDGHVEAWRPPRSGLTTVRAGQPAPVAASPELDIPVPPPPDRRRRTKGWAIAGVLLAVIGGTAAAVRLVDVPDDGSARGPAPATALPTATSASAASAPAPAKPFAFTFTGYDAGRFAVKDPVTVSSGYEMARIEADAGLSMYLTVFRPRVFAWQRLTNTTKMTVRGRPALWRSSPSDNNRVKHEFAWEYADSAWATVTAFSDALDDPSDADFTALAEGLAVGTPRPARLPITVRYTPAGYRPVEVGMHAWAGLSGLPTEDDAPEVGGVIFAKPAPTPSGLVDAWQLDSPGIPADHAVKDNFVIFVTRDVSGRKRTDGRVLCRSGGFCDMWLASGKVKVQVSSYGRLSDSEMEKVLRGVKLASSVSDDTTWPEAAAAVRGAAR